MAWQPETGLIIGKFLPPHRGHQALIDFALGQVDVLHVLVCSIAAEPIPGEARHRWVSELAPRATVLHHVAENPQEPHEHPDFWAIWRASIRALVPGPIDAVFASEPYGARLAEELGARFLPFDMDRTLVPVSGTEIRADPMRHWDLIAQPARPWFVRRVCIFGPESAGKTTLARDLARHYSTAHVFEWARPLIDAQAGDCAAADIEVIARGQIAAEEAMARQADRLMFCDTDLVTTRMWSEILFGSCPPWIADAAASRPYWLTLALDPDVPWQADPQRYQPDIAERRAFLDRGLGLLRQAGRETVVISGDWRRRFARAVAEIDRRMASTSP